MNKCDQCIVRQLSSLKSLSKQELIQLSDCKTSYSLKKGDSIFEEGEITNGVFCVKGGVGKLSKLSANGKVQVVRLVKSGELLGQRSMISNEPANLTATALDEMEVCFIPKNKILEFFDHNNNFSMNLMKSICEDLKDSENDKVNFAQKTVKERLAQTLLSLEESFGKNDDGSLKIQLTRDDLASIIGTATESCIRLLSDLKKADLIDIIERKIILKDIPNLKKMAG